MFRHSRLSFAVALALVGVTGAPMTVAQGQGEPTMLDALNVTATRSATKTDTPVIETPQSVSVVSREDWEEKGARTDYSKQQDSIVLHRGHRNPAQKQRSGVDVKSSREDSRLHDKYHPCDETEHRRQR